MCVLITVLYSFYNIDSSLLVLLGCFAPTLISGRQH